MFNYNIVGSSSKGNCIIIEKILMLDCGVNYVKIAKCLKELKLIFISHVHSDHLNKQTIKKIAYNYPNIKYLCSSKDVLTKLSKCGVPNKNILYLEKEKWYSLGSVKIKMQGLTHDVENCLLKWEIFGKKGVYITDTSNVNNIIAKNYNMYFIESNYREDILKKHIEECQDDGIKKYLNRVPNTHLSNEQANDFLLNNMGNDSSYIYIHESDYNYEEREE